MKKTVRNAVKCKICKTEIESKKITDDVACACGSVSVSGGVVLNRKHYISKDHFEDLSEYEEFTIEELQKELELAAAKASESVVAWTQLIDRIKDDR